MPLLYVLEELSHITMHDWLIMTLDGPIARKFFSCVGPYSSIKVYIGLGYIILKTQDLARAVIGIWAFDNPAYLSWSQVANHDFQFSTMGFWQI